MAKPGFSALPGVPLELHGIVKDSDTDDARPVLHIASHFAFKPDTEADSFLLLGDGSHLSLSSGWL